MVKNLFEAQNIQHKKYIFFIDITYLHTTKSQPQSPSYTNVLCCVYIYVVCLFHFIWEPMWYHIKNSSIKISIYFNRKSFTMLDAIQIYTIYRTYDGVRWGGMGWVEDWMAIKDDLLAQKFSTFLGLWLKILSPKK